MSFWEVFVAKAWKYLLGKALGHVVEVAKPTLKEVYVGSIDKIFNGLSFDGYLKLSSKELLWFYNKEKPISVFFAGKEIVFPATMVVPAAGSGILQEQKITFVVLEGVYRVPDIIDAHTGPILKKCDASSRYHDGSLVRVSSLKKANDCVQINIQECRYYDALSTNFSMDHKPEGWGETLRERLHSKEHSLGGFDKTPLVNHIGVVCMIETIDGMLIVQKRSNNVANRRNTLSASSSGSVLSSIFRKLKFSNSSEVSLHDFANEALRETKEELGVEISNVYFLGMIREFLRGGKPEMYFLCRTKATLSQVKERHGKVDVVGESVEIEGFEFKSCDLQKDSNSHYPFQDRVTKIYMKALEEGNLTLSMGLILAADHLLRHGGLHNDNVS